MRKTRHVIEIEPVQGGGSVVRHSIHNDDEAKEYKPPKTTVTYHASVPSIQVMAKKTSPMAKPSVKPAMAPKTAPKTVVKAKAEMAPDAKLSFAERMAASRKSKPKAVKVK